MKRLRQFFAGMMFGQSQVRREPAQLESPLLQLSVTPTEGLLGLFLQRVIAFLVPARMEGLFGMPAFIEIQFDSDEPCYKSRRLCCDWIVVGNDDWRI